MPRLYLALFFWFLCAAPSVQAIGAPPPVVNPSSYKSPSGEFVLNVDPTDLHGKGPAKYRLSRNGKEVWSGERDFTFFEGGVTDEGIAVGYGYSHGWEDWRGNGNFCVAILDAQGQWRLNESIKREASRFLHDPANPLAEGLIVDQWNDRVVVRVRDPDINRQRESWWVYRLSDGQAVKKFTPDKGSGTFIIDARPIRQTPLVLLHWWRYQSPDSGARFTLIDLDGKTVWSLELPRDYTVPGDEKKQDALRDDIRNTGAILEAGTNQFTLRFVAEAKKVTFSIAEDKDNPGKWLARELTREPYEEPQSEKKESSAFLKVSLKHLGEFTFGKESEPGPKIRDIYAFDFDDQGRLVLVRHERGGEPVLVLVDSSGNVEREISLQFPSQEEPRGTTELAWVDKDRWIVTISANKNRQVAWWLDFSTGQLTKIEGFKCPWARSITRTGDGGFAILNTTHHKYTLTDELMAFDASAGEIWRIDQCYDKRPDALFSPDSITLTSQNEIAVLDKIRNTVQFFDLKSKYLRTIDLKEAWGRKPEYASGIDNDVDGGVVVYESGKTKKFVRMRSDGSVRKEVSAKYADGRPVDARSRMEVDSQGRLWVTDGGSLMRLSEDGIVEFHLGNAPHSEKLAKISGVKVDRRGRVYAVDERTGSMHVFDSTGALLYLCKPDLTDFPGNLMWPEIAVMDDGTVYLGKGLGRDLSEPKQYIQFGPDGKRLGAKPFFSKSFTEDWFSFPSGNLLAVNYHDALLIDASGKELRAIKRRPDGAWLDKPSGAAVAPNGSFVITAPADKSSPRAWTISVYDSEGEPKQTITMPKDFEVSFFIFDGEKFITRKGSELCFVDKHGQVTGSFNPELKGLEERRWESFLTMDGRELWLVSKTERKVHRFEMAKGASVP